MYRVLLFTLFAACFVFTCSSAKSNCEGQFRFRNLTFLGPIKNCTKILGSLTISLIQFKPKEADIIQLPALEEVSDYIIVFYVRGIKSLGKIFPNLKRIGGNKLLQDYSLVVWLSEDLEEIGLPNLKQIRRGLVRIEKCPKLCYTHTVKWSLIGTDLEYGELGNCTEKDHCPKKCEGWCWNSETCQKIEKDCHPECIGGCSKPISDKHCEFCRHYFDKTTKKCLPKCPELTFKNNEDMTCTTEEDCLKLPGGEYFIFNNQCLRKCPFGTNKINSSCVRLGRVDCSGNQVENIGTLEKFKGCTHINGSLDIRFIGKDLSTRLKENLGSIESIRGCLTISRTTHITSLDFLQNLTVIQGQGDCSGNNYSLLIYENQNLQDLWEFNGKSPLIIENGTIGVNNNPLLCYAKIMKFVKLLISTANVTNIDVPPTSNGDAASCNELKFQIEAVNISSTEATLVWNISNPDMFYTLHYTPTSLINKKSSNDICEDLGWNSTFVSGKTYVTIDYLKPFTNYSYYLQIYSTKEVSSNKTEVQQFATSTGDPSDPQNIQLFMINSSSLKLVWEAPEEPNGNLSYYVILVLLEPLNKNFIYQRDYCRYPFDSSESIGSLNSLQHFIPKTTEKQQCDCDSEQDVKNKVSFFNDLCTPAGLITNPHETDCNSLLYNIDSGHRDLSNHLNNINKRYSIAKHYNYKKDDRFIEHYVENTTLNTYVLGGLKHFTLYSVFLSVCNEVEMKPPMCSGVTVLHERTDRNSSQDDVVDFKLTVQNNIVILKWKPPPTPNGVVVNYNLEYRSHKGGTIKDCLTEQQFESFRYTYNISNLEPGNYTLKLQTVSLAGPGYSINADFEILPAISQVTLVLYILLALVGIILIAVIILYIRYKRKKRFDDMHLIASINPDYEGPVYVEDKWEIDREDIEILEELGQGSFGLVYNGVVRSKKMPCAIKTASESLTVHDRMEFLNEASIMKAFSEAHHVVKLLGVVSRGQPPLVIMELMHRGDLKSFLRISRDNSQSLTSNEIYRMSAEIADGMAYLAAKKFVHRDLAARNCMVAHDKTVKIGDFGMARDVYETDYYRKETRGLLPVRWMAPESLADGVFTSDSDVWSYGVVLWEIATLSEQPYQGLANEQVLSFVIGKGTLTRPPECPDFLFEIMEACWKWRPNDRPLFTDIVEKLETNVGQDFRLVSFYHSREGQEHKLNAGVRAFNAPALSVAQPRQPFSYYNASDEEVQIGFGTSSSSHTPKRSESPDWSFSFSN